MLFSQPYVRRFGLQEQFEPNGNDPAQWEGRQWRDSY